MSVPKHWLLNNLLLLFTVWYFVYGYVIICCGWIVDPLFMIYSGLSAILAVIKTLVLSFCISRDTWFYPQFFSNVYFAHVAYVFTRYPLLVSEWLLKMERTNRMLHPSLAVTSYYLQSNKNIVNIILTITFIYISDLCKITWT
jgi:hypothetical protein